VQVLHLEQGRRGGGHQCSVPRYAARTAGLACTDAWALMREARTGD
jgi:hypothetical protein